MRDINITTTTMGMEILTIAVAESFGTRDRTLSMALSIRGATKKSNANRRNPPANIPAHFTTINDKKDKSRCQ